MTVDIRAKVICRIGDEQPEIISGGWSDDHVQGTGLIRTRGELVVKGLHRFTLAQPVELAYIQNGIASRFPRGLRVLSAFADPYRRQTTVQLGCKLTLLENLRGQTPQENRAGSWNDPNNENVACSVFARVTIGISAAYVASVCANRLNIAHDTFPLTNWYTVEEFDLSPGYVTVLSDLLVSESYVGFLDAGETLRIRSLSDFTGTYAVIDQEQVIDIGPINSGDIPGDSVSASYSYNRFKQEADVEPTEEEQQIRDWERDETEGPPETRVIDYEGGTYSRTVLPTSVSLTEYDSFDRMTRQTVTTTQAVASANPNYIKWFSENGGQFNDGDDVEIEVTEYTYLYAADQLVAPPEPPPAGGCAILYSPQRIYDPDRDGQRVSQTVTRYVTEMAIAGALDIEYSGTITTPLGGSTNWVYHPLQVPDVVAEVVFTTYETDLKSGITKTVETRQIAQAFIPQGNQVGASEGQIANQTGTVMQVVNNGKNLVNLGSRVLSRTDRQYGLQSRPSRTERNNTAVRKDFVESASNIVFVTGSASSQNITTYSVPYVSDDAIVPTGAYGTTVLPSDAPVKAARYARAQNQLAFGHRNGFSIQLAVPTIPAYPLDGIRIEGSGNTGGYVCNGTSWSFDSNGIVCNTDALFIGGVGETEVGGSLWFPVQPGITLLGPAPAVYTNPAPAPANSYEVGEGFDPLDPPPTFWDDDLPTATPAVPAKETEIQELVPPWREEISYVFAARTVCNVTRGYVRIPTLQPVVLIVRTALTAKNVPLRKVTLPVRTQVFTQGTPPAIRADAVEMFTLLSFGSSIL